MLTAYKSKFEFDVNIPLTEAIILDPTNPIIQNIFYMYTMESWFYKAVNSAGRTKDVSKIDTLGPYAWALTVILKGGEVLGRKDDPTRMKRSNP